MENAKSTAQSWASNTIKIFMRCSVYKMARGSYTIALAPCGADGLKESQSWRLLNAKRKKNARNLLCGAALTLSMAITVAILHDVTLYFISIQHHHGPWSTHTHTQQTSYCALRILLLAFSIVFEEAHNDAANRHKLQNIVSKDTKIVVTPWIMYVGYTVHCTLWIVTYAVMSQRTEELMRS